MPKKVRRGLPEPVRDRNGVQIYCVDVMEGLRALGDESVHCAVTSPPYWGLRDYGTDGQVGLEKTPGEYVERIVGVFRELRRVLRKDGTFWLNLGDSYASGGCGSRDPERWPKQSRNDHRVEHSHQAASAGLKPKDLIGIPWRVAFALQADGWFLRSDIVWSKPNPMPESVTDRPTKAHEYVFLLTKSARYFFDQEAVREKNTINPNWNYGSVAHQRQSTQDDHKTAGDFRKPKATQGWSGFTPSGPFGSGRNIRTIWHIPTQPFPGAHFATFPEALPARCIRAGTSEKGVCPECGTPWERVVEKTRSHESGSGKSGRAPIGKQAAVLQGGGETGDVRNGPCVSTCTIGWRPTCCCQVSPEQVAWNVQMGLSEYEPVPATVLDPFMGSGTTLFAAKMLGRHAIGFDINEDYCDIAAGRCAKRSRRGISRPRRLRKRRHNAD